MGMPGILLIIGRIPLSFLSRKLNFSLKPQLSLVLPNPTYTVHAAVVIAKIVDLEIAGFVFSCDLVLEKMDK